MNLKNVLVHTLANVTANGQSADVVTGGQKYAEIFIDVTSLTGSTPSVTFHVQAQDPQSGTYVTVLSTVAISAPGLKRLRIGPDIAAVANEAAADVMPFIFRVSWTLGGTVSDLDATVSGNLRA